MFLGLLKAATEADDSLELELMPSLTNRIVMQSQGSKRKTINSNDLEQRLTPSKPPTKKRD